jgi:hypothetical protein
LELTTNAGTMYLPPGVTSNGYVGNCTRQFLEVRGQSVFANHYPCSSDIRFKENFRTIDNPLKKVLQLTGKKYDYISESSDTIGNDQDKKKIAKLKKDNLGFVAQEVLKILPEAVVYDEEIDRYYLEYNAIVPVVVEAMKEQQTQIETLKSEISSLKNSTKEKSVTIDNTSPATLDQNIPNPFSANTTIKMYVPNTVSRSTLYIYNMQGEQIKQIAVNERGNTSVTIEGHSLKAGMYLYTLIADGKEVDTKKMILTE